MARRADGFAEIDIEPFQFALRVAAFKWRILRFHAVAQRLLRYGLLCGKEAQRQAKQGDVFHSVSSE
ncbi:hypothetical protein HA44_14825 [Mixta gaviniae]|nr:hypothetical protein HA44_14825 [Mixta gaviniae]